jgi:hypothetical protein
VDRGFAWIVCGVLSFRLGIQLLKYNKQIHAEYHVQWTIGDIVLRWRRFSDDR